MIGNELRGAPLKPQRGPITKVVRCASKNGKSYERVVVYREKEVLT